MASAVSIIARDDTLLGICFAIGEDFGFNPLCLRLPLGAVVLWSLPSAIGAYAVLGALVAFSRWLVPDPGTAEAAAPDASECGGEPNEELRLAA